VSLISREPNLRFERESISRRFLWKSFSSFPCCTRHAWVWKLNSWRATKISSILNHAPSSACFMVTRRNRVNPLEKRCEDLKLSRCLRSGSDLPLWKPRSRLPVANRSDHTWDSEQEREKPRRLRMASEMYDFYLRTAISDCLLIGFIRATETLRKNWKKKILNEID
jgi:hypothetical protein